MIYLDLFITFAKIGAVMFGGGYAMLPILQRDVVNKKKWATDDEIMDYFAIGQCTPGIIAVNTATFTGQKVAGNLGGIAATAGIIFPPIVIITLIAGLIGNFSDIPAVQNALAGIRVGVCVLMFNSIVKLLRKAVVDKVTLILFLVILAASVFFSLSPVLMVVAAAVCGLIIKGRG